MPFFQVISQKSWGLGIELVPGYRDFVKSQEKQGLKGGGRVNKKVGGGGVFTNAQLAQKRELIKCGVDCSSLIPRSIQLPEHAVCRGKEEGPCHGY